MDAVMPVLTLLGDYGAVWVAAAFIMLLTKKYRLYGAAVLLALLMSHIMVNILLKPLVARVRPCDVNTAISLLVSRPGDYSFPSGHTASSFAAAAAIFIADKRIGAAAILLAALIAFSRLYLYVHYPSDVLTGAAVGSVLGILAVFVCMRVKNNHLNGA